MTRLFGATTLFPATVVIFGIIAITRCEAATTLAPNNGGLTCPPGFDLVKEGQCRGSAKTEVTWPWNTSLNKTIALCGAIGADPIMIKNSEQQSYWYARARPVPAWMPLGIVCNMETKKWQWLDGSALNFLPSRTNDAMKSPCVPNGSWGLNANNNGYWGFGVEGDEYDFDFNCEVDIRKPVTENNDCFDVHDPNGPCYEMSDTQENWADAQKVCARIGASLASVHSSKENDFVRRLAVSHGYTKGLFLGASISGKADIFGWVDGSDWDYTNFNPGFPVVGYGDCVVMDTHDTSGKWVNTECSDTLPFVCSRLAFPAPNTTCLGPNTKEGTMISTPGFPTDASIPCEFFLKVDSGKQVEVEIVLLEANSCCDRLVLFEGSYGDDYITEMTGSMSGATFRTASSNVMRVLWEPNGGVNVRGAIITFRGV